MRKVAPLDSKWLILWFDRYQETFVSFRVPLNGGCRRRILKRFRKSAKFRLRIVSGSHFAGTLNRKERTLPKTVRRRKEAELFLPIPPERRRANPTGAERFGSLSRLFIGDTDLSRFNVVMQTLKVSLCNAEQKKIKRFQPVRSKQENYVDFDFESRISNRT